MLNRFIIGDEIDWPDVEAAIVTGDITREEAVAVLRLLIEHDSLRTAE